MGKQETKVDNSLLLIFWRVEVVDHRQMEVVLSLCPSRRLIAEVEKGWGQGDCEWICCDEHGGWILGGHGSETCDRDVPYGESSGWFGPWFYGVSIVTGD